MTGLVAAKTPFLLVALALVIPLSARAQAPAPVKETGQATCYGADNALVSCAGTGLDGELRPGVAWPSPRFTDNGDGTVTDELSGIVWLKDANCFGLRHWGAALSVVKSLGSGLCGLSDGSLAGDWRLPSVKELQSLIAYGYAAPALASASGLTQWRQDDVFSRVQWSSTSSQGGYWSSTSLVQSPNAAWLVSFFTGSVWPDYKENLPLYSAATHYVWPVRGGDEGSPNPDGEGGKPPVDTVPPLLRLAESVTVEATSAAGAVVSYVATAIDEVDGLVPATCAPTSGSVFPIGATTIICSATDAAGNASTGRSVVTVVDRTAPVLAVPAPVVALATSRLGAIVSYAVAAADLTANAVVSCAPVSGSAFPIGQTAVACTATDQSGNIATASFTVTVCPKHCRHRHHHDRRPVFVPLQGRR